MTTDGSRTMRFTGVFDSFSTARSFFATLSPAPQCRQSWKEDRSFGWLETPASGCQPSSGRQFRVFRFRSDEDGDAGVGVFPEREEILVAGPGFGACGVSIGTLDGLRLKRVGAGEAEVGERAGRAIPQEAAMVEDFLEFGGGGRALLRTQVNLGAEVHRIQTGICGAPT